MSSKTEYILKIHSDMKEIRGGLALVSMISGRSKQQVNRAFKDEKMYDRESAKRIHIITRRLYKLLKFIQQYDEANELNELKELAEADV